MNTILNYYSTGLFRMSRDTEMKQAHLKHFFLKKVFKPYVFTYCLFLPKSELKTKEGRVLLFCCCSFLIIDIGEQRDSNNKRPSLHLSLNLKCRKYQKASGRWGFPQEVWRPLCKTSLWKIFHGHRQGVLLLLFSSSLCYDLNTNEHICLIRKALRPSHLYCLCKLDL